MTVLRCAWRGYVALGVVMLTGVIVAHLPCWD
jgi:hypothetical protein